MPLQCARETCQDYPGLEENERQEEGRHCQPSSALLDSAWLCTIASNTAPELSPDVISSFPCALHLCEDKWLRAWLFICSFLFQQILTDTAGKMTRILTTECRTFVETQLQCEVRIPCISILSFLCIQSERALDISSWWLLATHFALWFMPSLSGAKWGSSNPQSKRINFDLFPFSVFTSSLIGFQLSGAQASQQGPSRPTAQCFLEEFKLIFALTG